MKRLAAALLLAWPLAAPASIPIMELILDASDNWTIAAEVNGRVLQLRVDPAAPGSIVLNPAAAAAAGLRPSMVRSVAAVGPVRLKGSSDRAPVVILGKSRRHYLIWFEQDIVAGADGVISPADLPFDAVTFRLRPPRPGERAVTIPLLPNRNRSLVHETALGGTRLLVGVNLREEGSRATASAAALIAAHHGGSWSGDAVRRPVMLGVLRPVRPMRLARPFDVGGLGVDSLLVRSTDHRGDYQLPADPAGDPDEIVVTGQGRKQRARLWLEIGRDDLARCSSLRYVRLPQRLELSCSPS